MEFPSHVVFNSKTTQNPFATFIAHDLHTCTFCKTVVLNTWQQIALFDEANHKLSANEPFLQTINKNT